MNSRRRCPELGGSLRRFWPLLGVLVFAVGCAGPVTTGRVRPVAGSSPSGAPAATAVTGRETPATAVYRELTVSGMSRGYWAIGPATRKPGLPLLVVLHGRGTTAQQESVRSGFLGYARRGLADLVYPVGVGESWNAGGGCCGRAGKQDVPDLAFLTEAVRDAAKYFESDSRRIYLVGYSNGAKLAFAEVCAQPGIFAAMATYGAVPLTGCAAAKPLPALLGAGSEDPLVRTEHNAPSAAAALRDAVAHWRAVNGCDGPGATTARGPLELTGWTGCRTGADVTAALWTGLTHRWPAAAPATAPFTTAVGPEAAAATVMWDFLLRHTVA
ncbi:hypothetical protein FNH05_24640 [Amycolatopsis rhizosphaerae]|uniref:Polyhydroxybutyrate depolymerase n=1 Tax=Amycolatopsis rhizosphaerae TaxID=2053003 RepID=A0A558BNI4_9PSEU|nr:hypothetical protein [Amycolatopsis rhizosphaerae]TVT38053.1 hypothetical protein FNH05_24640 [Amycolatopsis rhizosphaerae]